MEAEEPDSRLPDSPLLSIPAELREQIYGDVLFSDKPINLSASNIHVSDPNGGHHAVKSYTSLSRTCKQVHGEIDDIFWRRNAFTLAASRPLPLIPVRHVRKIRNISLCRTLIGSTFILGIDVQRNGDVHTNVEVVEQQERTAGPDRSKITRLLEDTMVPRLKKGAETAARMLRLVVTREGDLSMEVLQQVTKLMNEQWLIAM